MKPTMSDSKRSVLLDYIKRVNNEISTLYHSLEENESISQEEWKAYEKIMDHTYYLLGEIEEEVIFS
jgi:hypothetical protein